MQADLVKGSQGSVATGNGGPLIPVIIAQTGDAARRFIEFFTATIRNANTRRAYAKAVSGKRGHHRRWPAILPP